MTNRTERGFRDYDIKMTGLVYGKMDVMFMENSVYEGFLPIKYYKIKIGWKLQ